MHHPSPSQKRRRLQAASSAAAFALLATSAAAQFRASIQGTVTDPDGGVIPNVTLTLTDTETSKVLHATSNESGTFNFNALAPDNFTLTATATGFQTQTIQNVHVNPDQANAVSVKLPVGEATTTVNVAADTLPALDTETASINGNISSDQIQHLPSSGRDVFQLVQLAPGVFGDGARSSGGGASTLPGTESGTSSGGSGIFATENGPQANANGGQFETNGISIDGISTVSAVWGGASVITPTEDSVGNVKVVSNSYDAENGRFSGAQIQLTSKTGTNDFHGSLFFRAQRPGLNAYQRYNGPGTFVSEVAVPVSSQFPTGFRPATAIDRGLIRESTRANQYGGSIGGPIWKNRVFAFFAYETQRDNSSVPANGWYETPQFRAASPTGSIAAVYNNFNGAAPAGAVLINQTCAAAGLVQGTNCAEIANAGLDIGSPLKTALGTQDPTFVSPTNPGVGSGPDGSPDIAFYQTQNPTNSVGAQYNGRLDSDVTHKDHVAFAIYWVPLSITDYNGPVRTYNLYHHDQINDAYSGIWNHTFSPSLLNEARVNDAGWRWNEILTNPQEPFGLPASQVDGFGNLTSGNGEQLNYFGAPGPSNFNQHSYTFKDVATKIIGNHSIKFGGELDRLYYLNNPTYSARPSYTFYNVWNFLNDAPHTESGSFNFATGTPFANRQDNREGIWGGFVQDAWKARPNLTLNIGVRYAYFGSFYAKQNNLGVVQFGTGASTYTGISIRRGGDLTNPQTGNVGPQFGFSYAPAAFNNKAVLRGGYGLNFNQTEIAITGNVANNPPNVFNANFAASTPTAADPRILYAAPGGNSLFGYPANPNAISSVNSANLPTSGGSSAVSFQQNQPTIYTQHFSLDTQVDLGHQLVASVGYQGSVSRHLIVQSQLYVEAFALGYAQNPLLANVSQFANTGNSSNNSLLIGLKHSMSHSFQFDAEFNYAKTMDTGSGPYYQDPYPYEPRLAYGRSDFNYGKAFKIYGLWQPMYWHGNQLVAQVLNGWSVSGIYNIHTGFPFTANYSVPGGNLYYAASGYGTLRPAAYNGSAGKKRSNAAYENGLPNLNFANAGPNQTYFTIPTAPIASSTTGFATGLPQLPGVSRNSFDGPGYQDVDATLTKSFGFHPGRYLGEHAAVEFRADAFNLFNQVNLNSGSLNTNILTSTFGQASSALSGRTVNLQARFSF